MTLGSTGTLRWETIEPAQGIITEFLKDIEGHTIDIVGNLLWIIGGSSRTYKFELICRTLDLQTNEWEDERQKMVDGVVPSARQRHGSFVADDKIYVWGGIRFRGVITNELWVLDTALREWRECNQYGEIPHATSRFAGGYIENKDEYVMCCGTAIGRLTHGVHVMMVDSRTWFDPITKGAAPRHSAGVASELVREQLYVYGGTDYNSASGLLWVLDCTGPVYVWSQLQGGQPSPGPRINATMTDWGGRLFLVGGAAGMNTASPNPELWAFCVHKKRWIKAARPQDNEDLVVTGSGPSVAMHAATRSSEGLIVFGANRAVWTEEVPVYKLVDAEG